MYIVVRKVKRRYDAFNLCVGARVGRICYSNHCLMLRVATPCMDDVHISSKCDLDIPDAIYRQ